MSKPHKQYYYEAQEQKGLDLGLYLVPKAFRGKNPSTRAEEFGTHGCTLCAHASVIDGDTVELVSRREQGAGKTIYCPFEVCPYEQELSQYRCYEDYDRAERIKWKRKNWKI